jgi:protein-S-isoprenylcysteine O-methyltransferase Ste14
MKATDWEFKYRAALFGMAIWIGFTFYAVDQHNVAASIADWSSGRTGLVGDTGARLVFVVATIVLALSALLRTWASAYLHAGVVYASEVKSASLVADGPYRFVRNPLYFANVLMIVALGTMMSRVGFVFGVVAMIVFCYRLIFREESDWRVSGGESYAAYCAKVPRLWPSPWPRIAASGRTANWGEGFKAECWYWGFALALGAFTATLKLWVFFVILGVSLLVFWGMTKRKSVVGSS